MGVNTNADEHRDSAAGHVSDAIRDLSEIVINECWGHDDCGQDYKDMLRKTLMQLIEIRDKLR